MDGPSPFHPPSLTFSPSPPLLPLSLSLLIPFGHNQEKERGGGRGGGRETMGSLHLIFPLPLPLNLPLHSSSSSSLCHPFSLCQFNVKELVNASFKLVLTPSLPPPGPPLCIQCKYIISTWKLLAPIPAPAPPSPYNSPPIVCDQEAPRGRDKEKEGGRDREGGGE